MNGISTIVWFFACGKEDKEVNTAPVIEDVTIVPSENVTTSTSVQCAGTLTDADGDALIVSYVWTGVDGLVLGEDSDLVLTPEMVQPTDGVTCTIQVTDGQSSVESSVSIEVVNQPPVIESIDITNSDFRLDSEITCMVETSDPDLEEATLTIQWLREEEVLGDGSAFLLEPALVAAGEQITCLATVMDGYDGVTTAEVSMVVENTAPILTAVSISPANPTTQDVLLCEPLDPVDIDGDTLTFSYRWLVDGAEQTNTSAEWDLSASAVTVGQEVTCQITPTDGVATGASQQAIVVISNTPPVIGDLSISPNLGVYADSELSCESVVSDVDDDLLTTSYVWSTSNGVLGTDGTIQLTPSMVSPTETLSCTATVTDPHGGLVEETTDVSIENTQPMVSVVPVITGGTSSLSTVTCAGEVVDLNDGILTPTYEWALFDGTILGGGDTWVIDPTFTNVGDALICIMSAFDNDGGLVSDGISMTITNSPPVIDDLSISPNLGVYADSELSCESVVSDVDDDLLTTSYVWSTSNGVLGTNGTIQLTPSMVSPTETLSCIATVTDSHGGLVEQTTDVTIGNTLPMVTSMVLSQTEVYTDQDIEVVITLSDLNATQSLSSTLDWHVVEPQTGVDTVVLSGADTVLPSTYFSKGQQVYVVVTPFDGIDFGSSEQSSMVTVLNTAPTELNVSDLTLTPSAPLLEVDDLQCTLTAGLSSVDIDGDTLMYLFEWLDAEGTVVQSIETTNTTDILPNTEVLFPQTMTCRVSATDGEEYTQTIETAVSVTYDCDCPKTEERDYAFTYWPENFRHANFNLNGFYTVRHFTTGYYGARIDMTTGSVLNLAQVETPLSMDEAALSEDDWLTASLSSSVSYAVTVNGTTSLATDFLNSAETGTHSANNPSKLMDMGRFQQHIEIPEILYAGNGNLIGSLGIVSAPQHLVLTHRVTSTVGYSGEISLQTRFSGDLWQQAQSISSFDGTRALEVVDSDGVGWLLIAPELTDMITEESDGSIVVSRTVTVLNVGQELTIPVLILPMDQLSTEQIELYLNPESTVTVSYAQMNQSDTWTSSLQTADWNWERGAFQVPLGSIQGSGASGGSANWSNGTDFNIYNRHYLRIEHTEATSVHVPLFLDGPINTTFNITGGAPLFRSLNEEPTGVPIQVSKNWHLAGYWPNWFHMYSNPSIPSGSEEMELTVAIGKWGETFAASHAQLSLVGWGTNQQWDESALGAWGESITYDPDKTLRRAMVDDVRPFLMNVNGQYNWTGNVGGADFLKYVDIDRPWRDQQPTQLKTTYTAPGPVMTDVTYSGVTTDGAMSLEARTHLVRTDDLVRAYYVLHYEFLTDVEYARMGLFQIAADNYSDNGFTKYAYGDSTGVLFDGAVPNHGTMGYASDADRGIELTGAYPWVFMYDSARTGGNLPEHVADVGFVVRSYSATINGTTVNNPHININRTNNGGWSQMAFELGIPFDPTNTVVEAGSTIDAIVEYLVVPNDISLYYGPSTDMASVDPTKFGTTDIMALLADTNSIDVTATVGSVLQTQPTRLQAEVSNVAVEFELTGGFGYSPITIEGLYRGDGWQLQAWNQSTGLWEAVDQSVHDNDYWQTRWDESSETYGLTFSVETDLPTTFRLVQHTQ